MSVLWTDSSHNAPKLHEDLKSSKPAAPLRVSSHNRKSIPHMRDLSARAADAKKALEVNKTRQRANTGDCSKLLMRAGWTEN